jgi:Subtilase family
MARQRKDSTRSTTSRRRRAAPRRRESPSSGDLPDLVYAQASPHSLGGVSLFEAGTAASEENATAFVSDPNLLTNAASRLAGAGFQVLQISPTTINIAGPPRLYEQVFGTSLTIEQRPVVKELGIQDKAEFVEAPETGTPGLIDTSESQLSDVLEGVAIEEPRYYFQNAFAPLVPYWHLRVPGDVSLATNADRAHRAGFTGKSVKVVMTDSGWYRHPFFVQRGYRASPVVLGPAAANPNNDESGHGTAESANVFAVAPDVEFTMVKMNFVNTIGAFNAAVALSPHIISCSWGSSNQNGPLSAADQALAAAIAVAVARGIIVVVSAGNGHYGFPGQHPDVISAGGAFMQADGTFTASDYASGFPSTIYPGRNVPDVCGLVGMKPRAIYIMLPVEPNDQIDRDLAGGGAFPNGDQTAANDGWAAISGTSAAAPQLAGACALIKEACPRMTPAEVKALLMSTARDVTTGRCNTSSGGHRAGPGPDLATGPGLVDASRAALVARVRCLGPIPPIRPPVTPIRPPITPITPPVTPITPPITPIKPPIRPPISPITPPISPIRPPIEPVQPPGAGVRPGGEAPAAPTGEEGLTAEQAGALEDMILESDADVEL